MKDAVFGSLAAWIKADNFEAKRRFINDQPGLEFLKKLFCDSLVNQNFNLRLKKQVVSLTYDLLLNDDGIFEESPYHVRQHFCSDEVFLTKLRSTIVNADLANLGEIQYRDYILRIIFRLH